uniref:ribonuclease H n=1 Tax=Latimeria chalumnae TaxID=7897 RepID=H3AEI6_LATCH
FRNELGSMKNIMVKLSVKPDSQVKLCQARVVPYSLRPKVEADLNHLEQLGVLSPVKYSDWATSIVSVVKKDGSVQTCGDFKTTLNPVLCTEQYPPSCIETLFTSLAGGQRFSKLDLSNTYLQMSVDESSRKYLTITTQKGLYCYNHLPFGITSAPALFQRAMDQILKGVQYYLNDILVTGGMMLSISGIWMQSYSDWRTMVSEYIETNQAIKYLGHVIGASTSPEKAAAIKDAPEPDNVAKLCLFLGLLNYYSKFIPNLVTVLQPLNTLLCKEKRWHWTKDCTHAFKQAKALLVSSDVLTHYDPSLLIKLACDASPYGVGAVISHTMPNGDERPIAFASRTLSKAEQNYAQIERDALGIVFGVWKRPKSGFPSLAAARMQCWVLLLSAHTYDIVYREAAWHCNADSLSRLPLEVPHSDMAHTANIFHLSQLENLPVSCTEVKKQTSTDPVLLSVRHIQGKTPPKSDRELTAFYSRRNKLSVHHGCLMWGIRVIIPTKLQRQSYIWWPGIDKQIEEKAKACSSCQCIQKVPNPVPLHPWVWPSNPCFAGPFEGRMYLVIVDAHSKWPEVCIMESTTSDRTIQVLRGLFRVRHIRSAPYHPATNGLAERFVQTMKQALRATKGSIHQRLDNFLLVYRNTPHTITNESPAMLFVKRKLHIFLDLLKPNIKLLREYESKRQFNIGQTVLVRDYRKGEKWIPGVISAKAGPVSYLVDMGSGMIWRHHVDQLQDRSS